LMRVIASLNKYLCSDSIFWFLSNYWFSVRFSFIDNKVEIRRYFVEEGILTLLESVLASERPENSKFPAYVIIDTLGHFAEDRTFPTGVSPYTHSLSLPPSLSL
jgi:hypothetical protein